jgi:hypothetical protein
LDCWSRYGLYRHLELQHKLYVAYSEREAELTNHVFTLERISRYFPDHLEKWVDCNICASQLETDAQPHSTN